MVVSRKCLVDRSRSIRSEEEKKRRRGEKGGSENVAELWKMTIEFRDWSVHRSPHGEGEEGTDAVFMRMRREEGRKDRAHVDRGIR